MALGKKTTFTVQLALGAMPPPAPTQLSVSLKSPDTTIAETVSAALPEFVTVMICAALAVPTGCVAKVRLAGFSVIAGAAGPCAVSRGISQMPRP